jgi:hypothetical protein
MSNCGLPKGYEEKCCLNKGGWCTLSEAEYRDIDRALDMSNCGFIRVNDRYLQWKYGVPYKELNCGHCQHFKGETHGICTNENVEPRIRKKDEEYVGSRERWEGAKACKEFKKKSNEHFALYCSEPPACICERCLYHHSGRCPHGRCYDDLRAIINPYDKAHPDDPPRTAWSNWQQDQAYWCRGGIFYKAYECKDFVEYDESKTTVKECLIANVGVYQDGYIHCSLIEAIGCEECMKRFEEKQEWKEAEQVGKKIEQKYCRKMQSSCGGVNGNYYIECEEGRQVFNSSKDFNAAYDICIKHPEKCVRQSLKNEITVLEKEYEHWNDLHKFGGQDPFNSDGCNMYLVRNHIIYHKKEIEKICSENNLQVPEICHRELPQEVDMNYMARKDEIRENAIKALAAYKADENYQFLISNIGNLNQKQKNQTCISNVIGYGTGLEQFIESDKLIDMRRHENPERYLDSFKECAEKVRAILQQSDEHENNNCTCSTCEYSEDWGESVEYIKCNEGKRLKDVKKTGCCDKYYSCYDAGDEDEPEGDLEEQLEELLEEGDKLDKIAKLNTLNTGIEKGKLTAREYLDGIKEVVKQEAEQAKQEPKAAEQEQIYVYRGLV